MVAPFDWGLLIVASSGTICAVIAMIKVFGVTGRIEGLLDKLPKDLPKVFSPMFVAEVVTDVITKDLKGPDGSRPKMTDVITGYVEEYGPRAMAHFDKHKAEYIPLLLNPGSPPVGQGPGAALANQRWSGGGGLKAVQAGAKLAKVSGMSGIAEKIQTGAEIMGAVKEMVPAIKELRAEISGGKSGNGDSSGPSEPSGGGGDVWCPA